MRDTMAFALGAPSSSFLARPACARQAVCVRPAGPRMMADDKKGFFNLPNPFAKKDSKPAASYSTYSEPQPGDPGYKETPLQKVAEDIKEKASKLPGVASAKRGFSLLKEDLLKSAPEIAGVGRQDVTSYIKPQYGDPGYKPQAYEVTYVSELGISPFSDDPNFVLKVGGVEAVKKAAKEVRKGKKAAQIKSELLKAKAQEEPVVYDIPDYLKPLPEDTPRKGMTWKNYCGR